LFFDGSVLALDVVLEVAPAAMGSLSRIAVGDVVSLADFPGGDRPRSLEYRPGFGVGQNSSRRSFFVSCFVLSLFCFCRKTITKHFLPTQAYQPRYRHSRHLDTYSGETPGYPELEFHVLEPLTWQREDGRWVTRLRRCGEEDYLCAKLRLACGRDCPRKKRDKKTHRLATKCLCPRQLYVSLGDRKGEEAYSRLCGWIKDGMLESRRFSDESWLRRRGRDRVVVHHARPAVEEDSECKVVWVKDDSRFEGLQPCTPAEHDALHAAVVPAAVEAVPAVPKPVPVPPVQSAHEGQIDVLIQEGVKRGRPKGRKRKRRA
jgi:hypothetical protein